MRLRDLRDRAGIGQGYVAQALEVGLEDVETIEENDLRLLELDMLAAYVEALGMTLEVAAVDGQGNRTVLTLPCVPIRPRDL